MCISYTLHITRHQFLFQTQRFKVSIHQGLSEGRSPKTLLCAVPDEHHMSCFNICLSHEGAFLTRRLRDYFSISEIKQRKQTREHRALIHRRVDTTNMHVDLWHIVFIKTIYGIHIFFIKHFFLSLWRCTSLCWTRRMAEELCVHSCESVTLYQSGTDKQTIKCVFDAIWCFFFF